MTVSQQQEEKLKQRIAKQLLVATLAFCIILLPLTLLSLFQNGFSNIYLVHFVFITVATSILLKNTSANHWLESSIVVMFLTLICLISNYQFGWSSASIFLLGAAGLIIFALHTLKTVALYFLLLIILSTVLLSIGLSDASFSELIAFKGQAPNTAPIWQFTANGSALLISFTFLTILIIETRKKLSKSLIHLDEKNEQVDYLANHDHLTGLSSPRLAQEQLELTLNMAKRHEFKAAILYIDIDDFRLINDALGHDAGDYALKEVAKRIKELIRDTDIACRQGGDEFLIILHYPVSKEACDLICKRLIAAFDSRFPYKDHEIKINLSIGVAIYPDHGSSQFELRTKADKAMHESKKNHKHNFLFAN